MVTTPRFPLALACAAWFSACGAPPIQVPPEEDAGSAAPDAAVPAPADGGAAAEDAGSLPDAGTPDAGTPDAGAPDAGAELDAGTPVRFVALGDTGKANADQYAVAAAMQQKCQQSGCDFAVLLGDNIYPSGAGSANDPLFQSHFELPYANLNFPFFVVLGNHDYGANGAGTNFGAGSYEVQYTARSTKWRMPAEYYRFAFGNVEFFATDTNMAMFTSVSAQRSALKGWLQQSTATWKISLGHHPYKSNGEHGNAGNYDGVRWVPIVNGENVKDFFEDVLCGKVDLSLSGHDHSRQWLDVRCAGTELVVSGAGASTTTLHNNNPALFTRDTVGFLWVEVRGNTLKAEFVDAAGNVEFTRVLTK
ncbi:MAG: metallophosphoesterase [Deltaproteobacteria bacterium]|nr:metallophosphoesterase [Deltaproteobacteria bacterium]